MSAVTPKSKVLVVDDEPANRKLFGDMLRFQGYEPMLAASGPEALEILVSEDSVDAVLLDVMMPEMSGLEVLDALKARGLLPGLRVLVVSALTDRQYRIDALDRGATDFITKPIDRHEVAARLRTLIRAKQLQRQVASREARLAFLLSATRTIIYTCRPDPDFDCTYVSPNVHELLGRHPDEFLLPGFRAAAIHPDDRPEVIARISSLRATGRQQLEYRCSHASGGWRWLRDTMQLVRDGLGEPLEVVGSWDDVTDEHETKSALCAMNEKLELLVEERTGALQRSLVEKETLLKEIHHRVKNNLQIICSLLAMQLDGATDPGAQGLLQESIQRVQSMALIHERLYQSETLAQIDFGDYAETLSNALFRSYHGSGTVKLVTDTEPLDINIETAVPCGLILNELVTNALKHAFKDGRGGALTVSVRAEPEGGFSLTTRDTGPGMPPGFDLTRASSLGLQLITSLTKQIKGILTIRNDGGATFRIHVKEMIHASR